jgi:hypothetical protein
MDIITSRRTNMHERVQHLLKQRQMRSYLQQYELWIIAITQQDIAFFHLIYIDLFHKILLSLCIFRFIDYLSF